MRRSIEKILAMRFAVPLLIGTLLCLALIGEAAYRRAESTLTGGIKLTDARIGAAKLLQLLTDAETAQRGYLLTENATYIEPLRSAQREVNAGSKFFGFISDLGPTGTDDAEKIRAKITAKFDELDRSIAMAQAGDRTQALALVQTDSGRRLMDELRVLFDSKLTEAAQLQQNARNQIYESLMFNRIAVLVLSCVLALGLYLHMLRSRIIERERAQYQRTLEKEVAEKTAGLRTLHAWLDTAREDEKSRLARELHDELGGILTAAKMTTTRLRGKLAGDPKTMELIDSVNQRLNEGIALKRRIIEDLRPSALNMLGLRVALENLCAEVAQQFGVPVTADIADVKINQNAQLSVFRVVQEALTNVGKHSKATQVAVRLEEVGDDIVLRVTDNGVGFDPSISKVGSHGLAGMRFRIESLGGSLSVDSSPEQGLTICATLPEHADRPVDVPGIGPTLAM
jgi:signal transduction histidine kinase